MKHPANIALHVDRDLGQRAADAVTKHFGSWSYLIIQTVAVVLWISLNMAGWFLWHWDPYPFILLNLVFSTQASYAAPLILLSQNRSAEHDRISAEHDYAVNEADSDVNQQTHTAVKQLLGHFGIVETIGGYQGGKPASQVAPPPNTPSASAKPSDASS